MILNIKMLPWFDKLTTNGFNQRFLKEKRINIRLSSPDLMDIQARALEEGLPYQTLIASILHKYVSGRYIEKPSQLTHEAE